MNKKPQIKQWFSEAELPYGKAGIKIDIEIDQIVYDKKSEWGHIQVIDTPFYGRLLAIDGIVQVTESDEFIYHEMMAILPSLQHGSPQKVLIIGGGDGGVLKQALRLKSLETVTQVEIDKEVSDIVQKFMPSICAKSFTDKRTNLVYKDAYDFVKDSKEKYDVIVLDLTDPVPDGPAERLFAKDFYSLVNKCLADKGIVIMQCGSLTFQPDEVRNQYQKAKKIFKNVLLHNAVVPSYQFTTFGFIVASNYELPVLSEAEFYSRIDNVLGKNQFLNYETYLASSALPIYLKNAIIN